MEKNVYLIIYFNEENGSGHCVLTNTASEVEKYDVKEESEKTYYKVPIYDPNAPAFTDEKAEAYDKVVGDKYYNPGELQYISINEDGTDFIAGSADEHGVRGKEIYIVDINSMPYPLDGSGSMNDHTIRFGRNQMGSLVVKSKTLGNVIGKVDESGNSIEVYDSNLHIEKRINIGDESSDNQKLDVTYDGDISDLIFEVEDGCRCIATYNENVQGVELTGSGTFVFYPDNVELHAADSVKATVLLANTNRGEDDGAIANITLDSGEGAQFTLNDQKQYQVVSDDKIDSTVKVYGESGNSDKPSENVRASKKQKISVAKFKKTYSAKKLEQKKVILKLKAKSSGKGKISYKILKGKKNDITVSKNGTVTLKKGCKKGTYKILISANRKGVYKKAKKVITLKVRD